MIDGKRSAAEKQFYGALEIINEKGATNFGGETAVEVFKLAVENSKPQVEVKSKELVVQTARFQSSRPDRRQALSIRWLIDFSKAFWTFNERQIICRAYGCGY